MSDDVVMRKELNVDQLGERIQQMEDIDYWRRLNPNAPITNRPFQQLMASPVTADSLEGYTEQLREEGYFQTDTLLPAAMLQEMLQCIETVRQAGFPPMFALLYDVFYAAFAHFDTILTALLGSEYKLIPNFWLYFIETADNGKGFEPHRDAEYADTINADGLPTVLTLWITVTDAVPLNSCMYVVPAHRDPQYAQAVHDLQTGGTQFALEDIRALPTPAGTLSCWDQYLFHWGSRSSKRARRPRISYALYCQRGDMPPVDDTWLDLRSGVDFHTRLGLICRGVHRYSYMSLRASAQSAPLLAFMERHIAALKNT